MPLWTFPHNAPTFQSHALYGAALDDAWREATLFKYHRDLLAQMFRFARDRMSARIQQLTRTSVTERPIRFSLALNCHSS